MIETAQLMRKKQKGLYDLQLVKNEMSPTPDKYVFITIYAQHASVVVIDKELFNRVFFAPIFGQMIIGSHLQMDPCWRSSITAIPCMS